MRSLVIEIICRRVSCSVNLDGEIVDREAKILGTNGTWPMK